MGISISNSFALHHIWNKVIPSLTAYDAGVVPGGLSNLLAGFPAAPGSWGHIDQHDEAITAQLQNTIS